MAGSRANTRGKVARVVVLEPSMTSAHVLCIRSTSCRMPLNFQRSPSRSMQVVGLRQTRTSEVAPQWTNGGQPWLVGEEERESTGDDGVAERRGSWPPSLGAGLVQVQSVPPMMPRRSRRRWMSDAACLQHPKPFPWPWLAGDSWQLNPEYAWREHDMWCHVEQQTARNNG